MLIRAESYILPFILLVCCCFKQNATAFSSHKSIENRKMQDDSQNSWPIVSSQFRVKRSHNSNPAITGFDKECNVTANKSKKDRFLMISNNNQNLYMNLFGHHRQKSKSKTSLSIIMAHNPEDLAKHSINCLIDKKKNEIYSSSFFENMTSINEMIDNDSKAKRNSSVYADENLTLCWTEMITIKEDESTRPSKKLVIREYMVSLENSAVIPDQYVDCTRFEGELMVNDSKVSQTELFEVIEADTKVSKLVNFTKVSHVGNIIVWLHKRVKCANGPLVHRDVVKWDDGSANLKSRVEIKVSPVIYDLRMKTDKKFCTDNCYGTSNFTDQCIEDIMKLPNVNMTIGFNGTDLKKHKTDNETDKHSTCFPHTTKPSISKETLKTTLLTVTPKMESTISEEETTLLTTMETKRETLTTISMTTEVSSTLGETDKIPGLVTEESTQTTSKITASTESPETYIPLNTLRKEVSNIIPEIDKSEQTTILKIETTISPELTQSNIDTSVLMEKETTQLISPTKVPIETYDSIPTETTIESTTRKSENTGAIIPTVLVITDEPTSFLSTESTVASTGITEQNVAETTSSFESTIGIKKSKEISELPVKIDNISLETSLMPEEVSETTMKVTASSKTKEKSHDCENHSCEYITTKEACDKFGNCNRTIIKSCQTICSKEMIEKTLKSTATSPSTLEAEMQQDTTITNTTMTTLIPQVSENFTVNKNLSYDLGTAFSSIITPRHLMLRFKIVLEHVNEKKEKENLIEIEKSMLLNGNLESHKYLFEQLQFLKNSVSNEAITTLLNCTNRLMRNIVIEKQMNSTSTAHRSITGLGFSFPKVSLGGKLSWLTQPSRRMNVKYKNTRSESYHEHKIISQRRRRKSLDVAGEFENLKKLRAIRQNLYNSYDSAKRIAEMPLQNRDIINEAKAEAVRQTLPGIREDISMGLERIILQNHFRSLEETQGMDKSNPLDIIGESKNNKIYLRKKREATRKIGHWSNERMKRASMGGNFRSFTELTLYKMLF